MLTAPLIAPADWTWDQGPVTDLPKELLGAFPSTAGTAPGPGLRMPEVQPEAVIGGGSTPAPLFVPFAGRLRHGGPQPIHWVWGRAADLGIFPTLPSRLPFGNPLIALRFTDPAAAEVEDFPSQGLARGAAVTLANGAPVKTPELTVVAAFPRQPGFDTVAVLRALRSALTEAAAADAVLVGLAASWSGFVGQFDPIEAPLRLLEPGGRPVSGRQFIITRDAGPVTGTLTPAHRGNVLAAVGLSGAALGVGARLVASAPGEDVALASSEGPVPPATGLDLGGQPSHLDLALLNDWFGPQGAPSLSRFSHGNRVTPFVNGPAFFDVLFRELHAYTPGAAVPPVFYLAGFAISHDTKFVPAGAGFTYRTLEDFCRQFALDGGEARFLALQFLQLNPGFVETVENGALVAALIIAIAGGLLTFAQDSKSWDQVNFWGHTSALAVGLFFGATKITDLIDKLEPNKAAVTALAALPGVLASLDPYPAECPDNPLCVGSNEIVALAHEAQKRFNAFHQKIAIVRNDAGLHAYCGGIDLNPNRLDDRDHGVAAPFHDVHARIDGIAAGELATTFIQRWNRPAAPGDPARATLALDAAGAFSGLPTDGSDIVQVGRTYYGPDPTDTIRRLPFAPSGERTILDTMLQAIGQARRYIYIEDQYLTPPPDYVEALENAANQVSGPLIIVIPSVPDQPFGFAPRTGFVDQLGEAWGDRLKVGSLRQHFYRAQTNRTTAVGRLHLTADVGEGDNTVKVGPSARLPGPPFWITVGTEAMYVRDTVPESTTEAEAELRVDRAGATNLFADQKGTARAAHKKNEAVCAGTYPGIYVHAKVMLIDDVFATIGSANVNRRGHLSDGECNIFAIREALTHGDNWIRELRKKLWSEVLGLPEEYGMAALDDPVANLQLFDRQFVTGSRFSPFLAQPYRTEFDIQAAFTASTKTLGGVEFIGKIGLAMLEAVVGTAANAIFDAFVDPSSRVL